MSEVTSIAALSLYAQGQLVELPGFGEGQPFYARLRRPSIMGLTKSGKIPNALLSAATELFTGKQVKDDPVDLSEIVGVVDVICEAAFVEPTYQQIKDIGLELTDEQLMAVFNYSQKGIKALEPFRQQSDKHEGAAGSGAEVQETAV